MTPKSPSEIVKEARERLEGWENAYDLSRSDGCWISADIPLLCDIVEDQQTRILRLEAALEHCKKQRNFHSHQNKDISSASPELIEESNNYWLDQILRGEK